MLQPVQLEHVSSRFPDEITELRDFLGNAGVPVGTPEALGSVAARLQHDRGFHRDLMSYLWVAMDGHDGRVSSPELLGILAVAAAGTRLAAAADESAAHDLLRFIMDARRTMTPPPVSPLPPTPRETAVQPIEKLAAPSIAPETVQCESVAERPTVLPPFVDRAAFRAAPSELERASEVDYVPLNPQEQLETPLGNNRRYALWIGTALACLLLGVALGLFLYRGHSATTSRTAVVPAQPATAVPATPVPAQTAEAAPETSPASQEPAGPAVSERYRSPRQANETHSGRAHVAEPHTAAAVATQPRVVYPMAPAQDGAASGPSTSRQTAPAVVSGAGKAPASADSPGSSSTGPVLMARNPHPPATSGPAAPIIRSAATRPQQGIKPVGTDNLSKTLGWQPAPDDPEQRAESLHPRLRLRHHPGQPLDSYKDAETVAEAKPSDAPVVSGPNGTGSASSGSPATASTNVPSMPAPKGTVRSTSVGMMAGSEMFTPAPSYPVSAAQAHVQGQVKLQAAIDRDGNVAAARVISGPPQLRDAALDAVQRWRYRPFVSDGHTTPVNTTVVMDFELQ